MNAGEKGLAVVTGASGGIGLELARLLAKDGYPLVLAARRLEVLQQLAEEIHKQYGVSVTPVAVDLSHPDGPAQLFAAVQALKQPVEILINNAGFGIYGPFAQSSPEKTQALLRLNIAALTHLTHLFLPEMLQQNRGRILQVASTAAYQPGPLMAVYYASKAYVLNFSEALHCELQGTGVTVTALCPGPTKTDFKDRAGLGDTPLFSGRDVMGVQPVAQAGYRALLSGRRVVIPGWRNALLAYLARLVPRRLVMLMVLRLQSSRQLPLRS